MDLELAGRIEGLLNDSAASRADLRTALADL
jgi:hypothetical protein